jgi:hypothetical protein
MQLVTNFFQKNFSTQFFKISLTLDRFEAVKTRVEYHTNVEHRAGRSRLYGRVLRQ